VIHSGVPIAEALSGSTVQSVPSVFQGFGRARLQDILVFRNESTPSDREMIVFDESSLQHNEFKLYCFEHEGAGLLKATLGMTQDQFVLF
jgi:hypothetical protein